MLSIPITVAKVSQGLFPPPFLITYNTCLNVTGTNIRTEFLYFLLFLEKF